ncbi:hypothetical protein ACQZ6A_09050 [Agrobacterium vitis]
MTLVYRRQEGFAGQYGRTRAMEILLAFALCYGFSADPSGLRGFGWEALVAG